MRQNLTGENARFRKLIENSFSGVTLLDGCLRVIYRSPSAEKISGWSTAERAKTTFENLIYPDDQLSLEDTLKQLLKEPGQSKTCSYRSRHYDGYYMWVEATYSNMLSDPDVMAIVCNFRDISGQKMAELELKKQGLQMSELLESMADGFIALDERRRYTYANKQVAKMLGTTAGELIGKHIWTLFPDAVGSPTYQAIETAFRERRYICNEDFYPPLQLWQENRVYPSGSGVSMFIRDITKQKKEEHHLKLLESVITNTMDAIMITEAEPFDEPGPRIIYVNEAFTQMTGYTAAEVIGKTPRILQGVSTDLNTLKQLGESLRKWQACEATVINYKKNGEEFWVNFALNPVADEKGWYTHWISVERDVTAYKNQELRRRLLSDISQIFNEPLKLAVLLDKLLARLVDFGHFTLAEIWLIGADKNKISLTAWHQQADKMRQFYLETGQTKSFGKGTGLPGKAWATGAVQCWDRLGDHPEFLRREAAKTAGLQTAWSIPLISENTVIGALLLGAGAGAGTDVNLVSLFNTFGSQFGAEIRRKQLEEELKQVFDAAPDIICITGVDRYLKKINPAMSTLLEYTEEELLAQPITSFIHPDDLSKSAAAFGAREADLTFYLENRFLTRSGKIKWIAWTTTRGTEENLLFSVGKDITEKKELVDLLDKVTDLARIGGWELDKVNNRLYWSKMTKVIHEVPVDFQPDMETGINFYAEKKDRALVTRKIIDAIEKGASFAFQLQIRTAKNNLKWVRVVGEPEFIAGKCVRVYGSFQDVDARVSAEQEAKDLLHERNLILESIGDAFFAVDKNWTVNYWNNMAEKVLGKTKAEMLGQHLWKAFPHAVGTKFYKKYHLALKTSHPAHFDDYYPPLDKWYEISAYPAVGGLSVYFRDITERRRVENLLKDSEKRYSDLFQLSPLAKWVFDLETRRFLDVNEAALTLYGYTRDEFLSMEVKDLRPEEEFIHMEAAFKAAKKQKNVFKGVFTHHKKNREVIKVEVQSNNIRYAGRNAKIVVANDITERLKYVKAIEEQNKKLKEISWMQSHIIRAPLARIMGLIPLIEDREQDPVELAKLLGFLKGSSHELDAVICDITQKIGTVDYN